MLTFDPYSVMASDRVTQNEDATPFDEALEYDMARYHELNSEGSTSVADQYFIDNLSLATILDVRVEAYESGEPINRRLFRTIKSDLDDREKAIKSEFTSNLGVLDELGEVRVGRELGKILLKPQDSALYPGWRPPAFEIMSRFALQNSWLAMIRDFIGNRRRNQLERRTPSFDTIEESMIALSSSVLALRFMREYGLKSRMGLNDKQKIRAHDGFINELDSLGVLAFSENVSSEDNDVHPTRWVLPSPFFNDTGGQKVDCLALGVHKETRKIATQPFDLKLSKGKKIPHLVPAGSKKDIEALRLNCFSIGAVDEEGNPEAGKHSMDFREGAMDFFTINQFNVMHGNDVRLTTHMGSIAYGLALARVDLATQI